LFGLERLRVGVNDGSRALHRRQSRSGDYCA
jgi:hypothetical protein